jgi:hypothetical protein
LRYWPLFEFLLTLLKIRNTLGQRLILIAKPIGLGLDIRKLVGVACYRESKDGRCRYESLSHFISPKNCGTIFREPVKMRSIERELTLGRGSSQA